ncbi:Tim44-like domain protein, partial [Bordetella hinzii L60]
MTRRRAARVAAPASAASLPTS